MDVLLDWKSIIYINSVLIGLIIGVVLLVFGIRKDNSNILLGFSYIFLSYGIFIAFLIYSGELVHLPHLYRTGNIAGLLFAPLAYLYIIRVCKRSRFMWIDLIHFIPFLIYVIDFFPIFFMTSLGEKINLIKLEIKDPLVFVNFNQSRFFSPFFYTQSRTLLIALYWVLSVRVLYKFGKGESQLKNNFGKEWLIWMIIYVTAFSITIIPYYAMYFFGSKGQLIFDLIHLTGGILVLISGITILFFPKVLYGFNEKIFQDEMSKTKQKSKIKEEEPFPEDKKEIIESQLTEILDVSKKYLQKNYSIHELAKDTEVPFYLLSQYINKELGVTFLDLINSKRVEEACIMMKSKEYENITLEAIANLCGFSNRNTFITAFKKFKKITPSQYFKSFTID